jgi:aquaporin Z
VAAGETREPAETPPSLPRVLGAELFGTFALTLVGAGAEVVAVIAPGEISHAARAAAPALTVMAMIYALGDVSGAHINPVVTAAFAARRAFPAGRLPGYWLTQIAGATLAALLLRALFGAAAQAGVTRPKHGVLPALIFEIVLSVFLVTVIISTATRSKSVGPNAALAVAATILFDGLFGGPISGASMNPARSLGPALVTGAWEHAWIYVVGPFAGAALAVLFLDAVRGHEKKQDEWKAATGGPE